VRVNALLHAPFEGLGVIGHWLQKKNYPLQETHTYRGDTVRRVDDFDWLIVMGGPQNLKNLGKYPYLQPEIQLIKQAIQHDKLVVGICLGAQLIAESLGAKTEASPEKEIGFFPLELTEKGHVDPIMRHFPERFPAGHWHSDMPGLPPEASILAASPGCPRQIIRFKPRVYGLQCHLEFTADDIRNLIHHAGDDLTAGRYTQTRDELLYYDCTAVHEFMFLFLDHYRVNFSAGC
jgi:GMP synthase (glutamine-hydrolysing)